MCNTTIARLAFIGCIALGAGSCSLFSGKSGKQGQLTDEPQTGVIAANPDGANSTAEDGQTRRPRSSEANPATELHTVTFEYDSAELSPEAQQTLLENLTWIQQHPGLEILIEGHCDERGTIEYNLGLGEKRANSVLEFLTRHGIERNRLYVISYGEERPVDPEYGEEHWSKNRRVEFKRYE